MADSISRQAPAGIALFDLDGTLLPWDCQLLFRHHVLRREPWRVVFLPVFLALLPLAPILGAEGMKRVFLSFLFRMPPETLAAHSREFARSVMPVIYAEARAEIERHRAAGHLLILASASPECYAVEIGRELGFDLVLATRIDEPGLFPDLVNHKGAAKVRRLHEVLPSSYFEEDRLLHCHGYTDSRADLPMLALCGEVTLINPSASLTALGESSGWQILRPLRPWKSRLGFVWRALALLTGIGSDPARLLGDPVTARSGKNPASPGDTHRV